MTRVLEKKAGVILEGGGETEGERGKKRRRMRKEGRGNLDISRLSLLTHNSLLPIILCHVTSMWLMTCHVSNQTRLGRKFKWLIFAVANWEDL